MARPSLLSALLLTAVLFTPATGAEPTYWEDVRPVLRKHCTVCHNARNLGEPDVSGGLKLDDYEALLKNPKKQVLHAGKGAESLLVRVLTADDPGVRMPQGGKPLADEQIALIRAWIDAGAKEGTRPKTPPPDVVTRRPGPRRKLDVVLPTELVPPAGAFGKVPPAPLQLALRVGPLSPVTALRFSPDGNLLAVGGYGRVTLWDLTAGRPAREITSVLAKVHDVQFSPDGKLLAVAGGQPSAKGDLRLFRLPGGELLLNLGGHEDVVGSIAFRPDGQRLASASFDKTVRIWELPSGKTLHTFTGHSDFVHAVSYSPDGKSLASASKDRTVRLLDADTAASRLTFSGMAEDVLAVAFHPDGKQVISSGLEPGLYWWDAATGQRTRLQRGHGEAVHELTFSADGKALASAGGDRTVRLWDPTGGALRRTISVGSLVYAVALSPDGKTVAAGTFDGLVRLYDVGTGQHRATLLSAEGDKGEPGWLALTPQGHAAGSEALRGQGRWLMGRQEVAGEKAWQALLRPDDLPRALRGEKLPAPSFAR